jgi:aldose 1-epimerase
MASANSEIKQTAASRRGAIATVLCAALLSVSVAAPAGAKAAAAPSIVKSPFGKIESGTAVSLYRLNNSNGMQVSIASYGATIVSIRVPDRDGQFADVVHGFDSLDGYLGKEPFFGATIGRFGNRIARGKFSLDGHEYSLTINNGVNHLHGGTNGFDKRVWTARRIGTRRQPALEMKYVSADGEEGYPGVLTTTVIFALTATNELRVEYTAATNKPTVVNLTNHSYFNLAGEGDVLSHRLLIPAQTFTPVAAGLIPTGEVRSVVGTPLDFTEAHTIGERIDADDEQMRLGRGYDHNWILDGASGQLRLAARVSDPKSGRVLELLTTEPGLQFYSGNFLDGSNRGKAGKVYERRSAFCLEPQHYPDSPNQPAFPDTTLRPGQQYRSTTVYRFSTEK